MGEWLLSRRDSAIVAWHEVPGNVRLKVRTNRRVKVPSGREHWPVRS
jgi:hypothetical protein